ncbi:sulfatase [Rapidithrix thailandica]|uniref:Sulfatase n=1 Tax=Rapidithrix thailandica TaxID=413964 RepID=A0AAW9S8T4_9BACT
MMMRTLLLSLLFACLFFTSCTQKQQGEAETSVPLREKPNIVILFCDDMGYGDLGVYGHPTIKTPNLDRMAGEGMRFTQFYSGSPACSASRYSLLTGRYPIRSGFGWVLYPDGPKGMHPEEYTLAEGLKDAGYKTGMFGKWHLGNLHEYLPVQHGFDEYLGLPYSNDMIPPKFPDIALFQNNDTLELNPDQTKLTKMYTERAVNFIKGNKKDPFFLYLPYAMPHVPLMPGKDFQGKSMRGKYGDVVEEIDWSVGQILETLQQEGLAENTLVFFTSDNGPWIIKDIEGGSAGLFRDGKGSTWEGGMREPAIAWWPGTIKKGSVCAEVASTLDLYVSALQLAKQEIPTDRAVDGKSIVSLLKQSGEASVEQPYFYYGMNNYLYAVRKGAWKLHIHTYSQTGKQYFEGKLPLLFNIEEDPSEKYDLSEQYPEKIAELQKEIDAHEQKLESESSFFAKAENTGEQTKE